MSYWDKIKFEYHKGNSAIRQIIMINLGVFIFTILIGVLSTLMNFDGEVILQYFEMPSDLSVLMFRPWTVVTNVFFHAGFMHIFGNLLILYIIGRILEDFMSSKDVWRIFLFGGIAGSLIFLLSYNIFPVFAGSGFPSLIGASGGVTAIVVATGIYIPRYAVQPFGLFRIEMRWIALVLVFRDLASFPGGENLGGLIAHVGGALLGVVYILHIQGKIKLPTFNLDKIRPPIKKKRRPSKSNQTKKAQEPDKPDQEAIDAILDKISHSGYDSLTKEEKSILFQASE